MDYLEEEMQAILDGVDINSRTGIRDSALLLLLYNTGARVSEIVMLEIPDLSLNGSGKVQLLGKGNKYRSCPLWPETIAALKDYLEQRSPKEPKIKQLFLNANGDPITRFGIRYITKKYAGVAREECPSIKDKAVTLSPPTAMICYLKFYLELIIFLRSL